MNEINQDLYNSIARYKYSNDLVKSNLRLVVHYAKQYQNMGLPLGDLINEGVIGLCRAKELYDKSKGSFSTYATLWIKGIIREALDNKSRLIRIPAHLTENPEDQIQQVELDPKYFQNLHDNNINNIYDYKDNSYKVNLLLKKLKPKQAKIIAMKYGMNCPEMKTKEIAKELNMTVQAINRNIRVALEIMKS